MTGWMINIRMRRIEEVARHKRCDREGPVKCYQGPGRTYMLNDNQVRATKAEALLLLRTELKKIHADRADKQQKLAAEIDGITRELNRQ
jgi:hypothetical protein